MHKKSQIQIGETIAVLFVFFILIAIGLIFYAKVIKDNIELEKDELAQLGSIKIDQIMMSLPELGCSKDVVKEVQNCIDVLKLESAQNIINKRENEIYYYDLFEFSEINVSQIYPTEFKLNVYSRVLGFGNFSNQFVTNIPVSLYYPITSTNGFGVLTIVKYSR